LLFWTAYLKLENQVLGGVVLCILCLGVNLSACQVDGVMHLEAIQIIRGIL